MGHKKKQQQLKSFVWMRKLGKNECRIRWMSCRDILIRLKMMVKRKGRAGDRERFTYQQRSCSNIAANKIIKTYFKHFLSFSFIKSFVLKIRKDIIIDFNSQIKHDYTL